MVLAEPTSHDSLFLCFVPHTTVVLHTGCALQCIKRLLQYEKRVTCTAPAVVAKTTLLYCLALSECDFHVCVVYRK